MPRYVEHLHADPAGTVNAGDLPNPLPFNLTPTNFFRTVEDIHEVLHEVNSLMHAKGYQRMEELLDPAGFSGMVSRTGVDRLGRASRALVMNKKHNGYPDLLVDGQYAGNAVQHGEGGLEVKATRSERSWQTHGPRAGWFCVFQFEMDDREDVALFDREPTRVVAVLVAELEKDDWSWQPAKEGKIRSGTASMRASGIAKCRAGAVWVDPAYRDVHATLLAKARADAFREDAPRLVEQALRDLGPATVDQLVEHLAPLSPVDAAATFKRIAATLDGLRRKDRAARDGKVWRLTGAAAAAPQPVAEMVIPAEEGIA